MFKVHIWFIKHPGATTELLDFRPYVVSRERLFFCISSDEFEKHPYVVASSLFEQ